MARAENAEIIDRFEEFYRDYYREAIGDLAGKYPTEQRSLYVDWNDIYRFDPDLAEDFLAQPDQMREYAEEALRLFDLPVDVKLGQAHVRVRHLPEATEIRGIRADHAGRLVAVRGIVRKATDVLPKIQQAAFECQRCGTLTRIPQTAGGFQEPHECQGCERQGPFEINFDQSEFQDYQKLRVQESPEGLRGGETPQSIDVNIEDDITGKVTAGDHVKVTGILHLEQQGNQQEKSPVFDFYMDGMAVEIEDEQFEDMDISDADKREIVELSNRPDIYELMVASLAPSLYGLDDEKLAIILQLFSGVAKKLPDKSRIRGDLHLLLIGDPGTGKCVSGDTRVRLGDAREVPIKRLVERNLEDPIPVDDGVYDEVDIEVPSMAADGSITTRTASKVWKREAPAEMYRIRTWSGREIEVTPSHPLFVRTEDGDYVAGRADALTEGHVIATVPPAAAADGGSATRVNAEGAASTSLPGEVTGSPIESIERVEPDYEWVYDLEVEGTHTYLSNDVVSHNSQLLQYVRNLAPRAVYTSGKGSSTAGLTAAAVRDDFGDSQQWTLEAGALVLADQGVAAVDELDKMRCVAGDTLVSVGDGRVTRIRELAREAAATGDIEKLPNGRTVRDVNFDAWTMADDGRLVTRPVTAIHEYDAPDNLTEVTLESGETVTATRDHPFFVFDAGDRVERSAEDLEEGDWVFVPRQLPNHLADGGATTESLPGDFPPQDATGPAMGAILGYLSGDGNVYYDRDGGTYGIRFTNKEPELLTDFERACRTAFGGEPVRHPSEQRADGVETVRLHGQEYAKAVLDQGMNLGTYNEKAFPDGISEGSMATKAAFIRALADSEGHVDVATGNVAISSASYEILLGIKSLLLEFGVSCQIQTERRAGNRDIYELYITAADSLKAFGRHIGFTLERKQAALEEVCTAATGDRTIIDVIPDCGPLLKELRESLRLHQSECGLVDATYCNFETGEANISIIRARRVYNAFEHRREQAAIDRDRLQDEAAWEELETLKSRYHVSQRELAEGTEFTQAYISRNWGADPSLRRVIRDRLREEVSEAAETDLTILRDLVHSDVKWRRVSAVDAVSPDADDDRIELVQHDLDELLECPSGEGEQRAQAILDRDPVTDTWSELRSEMERHGISFQDLADELGVAGSTVSRWFNGVVETDQFETVRTTATHLIEAKRGRLRSLLEELEDRRTPKVYDLTVEGTHNFVANGMVVHNSEDRSAMHEALEQQSYHPDSEILLADGRQVEIGEFVDSRMAADPDAVVDGVDCEILPVDDVAVHSTDLEDRTTTKLPVDRVSRHEAPEQFVEVTFSNGRSVTVTPEHPMFVDQGGEVGTVPASAVSEGAFVPAPRKLPNSSSGVELDGEPQVGKEKDVALPEEVTPALGELLGFLVAEGHSYAGSSHEIGFSNQDDRLLARVDDLFEQVFGMESYDSTNAAGTVTKSLISTKLYRWFEANVPEFMHTARDKRIPATVLGASEEVIRRFLVGAFAGDGGVESEAMSFSTASEGLAQDYADALSKIGVASRIHHDVAEDSWKVYVMGDSNEQFVDQVVEAADERHGDAQAFVERGNETKRHHDVLPTSAARELRELRRLLGLRLTGQFKPNLEQQYGVQVETVRSELTGLHERAATIREAVEDATSLAEVRSAVGWSGRQLAERMGGATTSRIHYAEGGGYDADTRERLAARARATIHEALEEFEHRAAALADRCELRFYRVRDVETVPNEGEHATDWVYDVTVEPTNTFVSKGVVLHNSISISKAGINATLKSRCSLLGAANPKYGRFDQYEPIGEQIDLEPALVSRFDLIFTVTDKPDPERDRDLAEHIIRTNYAGELNTHRTESAASNVTADEVEAVTESVEPAIETDLLRKYVAYAKRNCFPTMTEEAKEAIKEFYVDLRAEGADEDAPVPVTARKLEALVRLAEASARVRLSDTVEAEDADRVIEIVRSCLRDIGVDPETGEFDADVVETGTSKSQRDRIRTIKGLIEDLEDDYDDGAPVEEVLERAETLEMERSKAEHEIEKLKRQGEVYEPRNDHLRTT